MVVQATEDLLFGVVVPNCFLDYFHCLGSGQVEQAHPKFYVTNLKQCLIFDSHQKLRNFLPPCTLNSSISKMTVLISKLKKPNPILAHDPINKPSVASLPNTPINNNPTLNLISNWLPLPICLDLNLFSLCRE